MPKHKPTTSSHAHPDDTPRSPRKPRQNYRQLNDMRAPNRSPEEIAAARAEKEQRQRDKVTKKRKTTANLAQFENDAVHELLQKGRRPAQPPAQVAEKVKRPIAQVSATTNSSKASTNKNGKARQHEEEANNDEDEDELEEVPPEEEAPTDNEFEESHAASEEDVAPTDDNDDYEDAPQPTKAKASTVKKLKPGKALYDDVQRARTQLNGHDGQTDKRTSNTTSTTKSNAKKGGVRTAYSTAPTPRNRPTQNASRAAVAPEPADIEARYGGVVDSEEDEDDEEEHEHAKKSASTGKAARSTSQSIAAVAQVVKAPKASTRTKKGKSRASTPAKQSDLPDPVRHNFSDQYLLQALALFGVDHETDNPYKINDEPALFRTAFKQVYPSAIFKQYGKNIASGELIFQLTSSKFRSWRNALRMAGETVVNGFFTSVHPDSGTRLFPTADSIKAHVRDVLHDWGRAKGGQPFHWRVFTSANKSGAYEDRLLMKILARHFDLIAHIDTSWLPSQEPFAAMLLALISVHSNHLLVIHSLLILVKPNIFKQYVRALTLWSTGVFDTKEAASAMNDDKWGAEAERQAKRLRAVTQGKPEKWKTIVSLAKAEMKKSTPARSHRLEIENDDSDDEPMFLSGDEIDPQGESGHEGAGRSDRDGGGGHESEGNGDGDGKDDDGKDEEVVEAGSDGNAVAETARKGEVVESGRAEDEVDEVSPPVAPKPKRARLGKKGATAKAGARASSRRDDDDGGNGNGKEVVSVATKRRKRKAVLVESEPEDEEDTSLGIGSSTAHSVKRYKVSGAGGEDASGRDAEDT